MSIESAEDLQGVTDANGEVQEVRGDGVWVVMDDHSLFGYRPAGQARNPFRAPFPITEKQYFSWSHEQAWLYTVEEFREFDLHVEYRLAEKGNSGVSIRDTSRAKHSFGPEVNYSLTPSHIGYEKIGRAHV